MFKDIPKWVWLIVIPISIFIVSQFGLLIGGFTSLFGVWMAISCFRWSKDMKGNCVLAFFVGFFFGWA